MAVQILSWIFAALILWAAWNIGKWLQNWAIKDAEKHTDDQGPFRKLWDFLTGPNAYFDPDEFGDVGQCKRCTTRSMCQTCQYKPWWK